VFDGEDITKLVSAYRLEAVQGDVPMVILELKPGVDGSTAVFDGIANIRIGVEGPTPLEFLEAIDPDTLQEQVLTTGDFTKSPIADALDILRDLARKTQP
jgi:hypothetical protein